MSDEALRDTLADTTIRPPSPHPPPPTKMSAITQTYETAFVPCEACAAMQANVIKVINLRHLIQFDNI